MVALAHLQLPHCPPPVDLIYDITGAEIYLKNQQHLSM